MAALTVADELAETGDRLRRIEQELAALQEARVGSAERAKATQAAVAAAFNSRGRADRAHHPAAEPDRRRRRRGDGVKTWHGSVRGAAAHYIIAAGLRGASETYSRGLIDPEGSCP